MTKYHLSKKLSWLAVLLWMLMIFLLSAQPASVSNSNSKGIVTRVVDTAVKLTRADIPEPEKIKLVDCINSVAREYMHGVVFLVLGALTLNALAKGGVKGAKGGSGGGAKGGTAGKAGGVAEGSVIGGPKERAKGNAEENVIGDAAGKAGECVEGPAKEFAGEKAGVCAEKAIEGAEDSIIIISAEENPIDGSKIGIKEKTNEGCKIGAKEKGKQSLKENVGVTGKDSTKKAAKEAITNGAAGMKTAATALIICVIYGLTDEIHQIFVPGRAFQVSDLVMDSVGSIIGIGFVYFFNNVFALRSR